MAHKMRVRTRRQDGKIEILILIQHPMETGLRKDKQTHKLIPAHFIKNVDLEYDGKLVASAELSISISQNPLIGFRLNQGKDGDKIKINWNDNKGESGHTETVVSL